MELITEILRGIRDTADMCQHTYDENDAPVDMNMCAHVGPDPSAQDVPSAKQHFAELDSKDLISEVTLKFADGHKEVRGIDNYFKNVYYDEYTNEPIAQHLVKEAMLNELK